MTLTQEERQAAEYGIGCDPECEGRCRVCPSDLLRKVFAEVQRLQGELDAATARAVTSERLRREDAASHLDDQAMHIRRWQAAESSLARVEAARAALEELVQAILASVREDEKGEQWTIRAFLDKRGVYHENMSGSRRLVVEACKSVLSVKAEAR